MIICSWNSRHLSLFVKGIFYEVSLSLPLARTSDRFKAPTFPEYLSALRTRRLCPGCHSVRGVENWMSDLDAVLKVLNWGRMPRRGKTWPSLRALLFAHQVRTFGQPSGFSSATYWCWALRALSRRRLPCTLKLVWGIYPLSQRSSGNSGSHIACTPQQISHNHLSSSCRSWFLWVCSYSVGLLPHCFLRSDPATSWLHPCQSTAYKAAACAEALVSTLFWRFHS